jgi:hypothetical protein
MTDAPAVPPPAYNPGGYPVQAAVTTPETIDRWRVLQWVAAIPHFIILYVLNIAAEVVAIIAWFAILFTGAYPPGLWDFAVGVQRWQWRATTYALFLHTKYPPFQLDSGETDPATEPALLAIARPTERNRLTCALRIIWAIPAALFMIVIMIALYVVAIIAWFVVLFTGKWPEGMRTFAVKGLRAYLRYQAYAFLMVDEYPPFSLD